MGSAEQVKERDGGFISEIVLILAAGWFQSGL